MCIRDSFYAQHKAFQLLAAEKQPRADERFLPRKRNALDVYKRQGMESVAEQSRF